MCCDEMIHHFGSRVNRNSEIATLDPARQAVIMPLAPVTVELGHRQTVPRRAVVTEIAVIYLMFVPHVFL
jgi:hypothetical protein